MVLNKRSRARGKLEDKWEHCTYVIVSQPNIDIPVYVVKSEGANGEERVLHRNMLSPCKFDVSPRQGPDDGGRAAAAPDTNKDRSRCMYPWVWGAAGPAGQPIRAEMEPSQDSQGSTPNTASSVGVGLASPPALGPSLPDTEGPRRSTRNTKGQLPQRYQMGSVCSGNVRTHLM